MQNKKLIILIASEIFLIVFLWLMLKFLSSIGKDGRIITIAIKVLMTVVAVPLLITSVYYGSLFARYDFDPHFIAIDHCLDTGGKWDHEKNECVYRREIR